VQQIYNEVCTKFHFNNRIQKLSDSAETIDICKLLVPHMHTTLQIYLHKMAAKVTCFIHVRPSRRNTYITSGLQTSKLITYVTVTIHRNTVKCWSYHAQLFNFKLTTVQNGKIFASGELLRFLHFDWIHRSLTVWTVAHVAVIFPMLLVQVAVFEYVPSPLLENEHPTRCYCYRSMTLKWMKQEKQNSVEMISTFLKKIYGYSVLPPTRRLCFCLCIC